MCHHFGRWWGVLFDAPSGDHTIHWFNWSTSTWTNTGVLVDNRNATHGDVRSDGNLLYVASAQLPGASSSDSSACLRRYTYDPALRYNFDAGYPAALHGALATIVIDKDTRGMVWSTVTASSGASTVEVTLTGTSIHRTTVASLGTEGVRRIQLGTAHKHQRFDAVYDGLTVRS